MSMRWTEEQLADFERNSGRGLPKATIAQMEKAQGVKLDASGRPLPKPLRAQKAVAPAPTANATKGKKRSARKVLGKIVEVHQHPTVVRQEDVERAMYRGTAAPAIARYRKRAECDDILFDSQLEMRRYQELKLLKAGGEILYFLRQVPFHLPGGIIARVDFAVVYLFMGNRQGRIADTGPVADCVMIEYEDCKAAPKGRTKGRFNDHDRVGVNKRKQIKALYGVTVKLVHKARG